jgi:hypothetical protein
VRIETPSRFAISRLDSCDAASVATWHLPRQLGQSSGLGAVAEAHRCVAGQHLDGELPRPRGQRRSLPGVPDGGPGGPLGGRQPRPGQRELGLDHHHHSWMPPHLGPHQCLAGTDRIAGHPLRLGELELKQGGPSAAMPGAIRPEVA